MTRGDKVLLMVLLWIASTSVAMAHPPYVEPWKHVATVSVSGLLGISVTLLLRKKITLFPALIVGGILFLVCIPIGVFLSIIASM